MMHNRFALKEY